MNAIQVLPALLKREILEHKNIWRVPVILIAIAMLVKISMLVGNLAIDFNVPEQLRLDQVVNATMNSVVVKTLSAINFMIMSVMLLVAVFYALACLFNERQDQSVLFWRSLPISDSMTIVSKLVIALLLIPLIILLCQALVAVLFLGAGSAEYLTHYFAHAVPLLIKIVCWSLLPIVAWCVCCSTVANKNPVFLAVIVPIIVVVVDHLFFNGMLGNTLVINRLTGFVDHNTMTLAWGVLFSVICIMVSILKRSQRI